MLDSAMMTDLDEILALLVEQVDGALAAAVAGMDGLIIEQYPPTGTDLAALAAEFTFLLSAGSSAMGEGLDGGELRELILTGERRLGYVRVLGGDLYCLVVLSGAGNLGKARLYSEQAARRLAQVLA